MVANSPENNATHFEHDLALPILLVSHALADSLVNLHRHVALVLVELDEEVEVLGAFLQVLDFLLRALVAAFLYDSQHRL